MDFLKARQAAEKWGVSERRVQKLCGDGRIDGVVRPGRDWLIPKAAEKPADPREARKERKEPYHTGKKGDVGHGE